MKIEKEIKKHKTRFHSKKSCFPLSKTIFNYVVCPNARAIPQQKRKKKMLLTIEHLISWPLGIYNFTKAYTGIVSLTYTLANPY